MSVPDARLPRVSESPASGPPPQIPPMPRHRPVHLPRPTSPPPREEPRAVTLRQRLAELRGPAVAPRPLDARALAALAANPGCKRRALLDGAGCRQGRPRHRTRFTGRFRPVPVRLHAGQRLRGQGQGRRRYGADAPAARAARRARGAAARCRGARFDGRSTPRAAPRAPHWPCGRRPGRAAGRCWTTRCWPWRWRARPPIWSRTRWWCTPTAPGPSSRSSPSP